LLLARLQAELHQLEAVPGLKKARAPPLGTMYLSTLPELDMWIKAAFSRSVHHRTQRVLLQREADRAESDRHSAKLHGELFQRGTNQLRQLLKPHAHKGADPGKVTQLTDKIKIIAGSYCTGLLGGLQGEQRAAQGLHVDRQWAEDVLWEQTRGKWVKPSLSHITTPSTMGCKQGWPLSPIKFCIFINMFYSWLTATSSAGYAPTSPCDAQGDAPPSRGSPGVHGRHNSIA
jgi:hypothetical protein